MMNTIVARLPMNYRLLLTGYLPGYVYETEPEGAFGGRTHRLKVRADLNRG